MIDFLDERIRERFHLIAPEVQVEIQRLAEKVFPQGRRLQIDFVDQWGVEQEDYEISLRIVNERKQSLPSDD